MYMYCNETNETVLFTLLSRKTVTRKIKLGEFKSNQKYLAK